MEQTIYSLVKDGIFSNDFQMQLQKNKPPPNAQHKKLITTQPILCVKAHDYEIWFIHISTTKAPRFRLSRFAIET
jgi:hypothetical protein